jgi:hypothetical protein
MAYVRLVYGKTIYHINVCENCLASVAVHSSQFMNPVTNNYLMMNIPCCDKPFRQWNVK